MVSWVRYSSRRWLVRRSEALKLAAYARIAAEEGREKGLDASLERAIRAGIV